MENVGKRYIAGINFTVLAVLAILTRLCSVLYSVTATDVVYENSIVPDLLLYGRQALECVFWGCGFGYAAAAFQWNGKKAATGAVWMHTAIQFLYTASALLIDWQSGSVTGFTLVLAAITNGVSFLFSACLIWLAFWLLCLENRRHSSVRRGCIAGCIAFFAGHLAVQTIDVVRFFIQIGFQPYRSELLAIGREYLTIFLLHGIVAFLSAWAVRKLHENQEPRP